MTDGLKFLRKRLGGESADEFLNSELAETIGKIMDDFAKERNEKLNTTFENVLKQHCVLAELRDFYRKMAHE